MVDFNLYLPISKIDKERRIVEGIATTETVDKQNEVVDYNASKTAFDEWGGAIREMHEPKAVGKAVEIIKDDASRQIYVKAYISKGAEDTWQKVQEGVLKGFSIGGKTIDKCIQIVKDAGQSARQVTRITKYQLNELSLVDNPANPEATLALIKMAGDGVLYQTDILEDLQKTVVTDTDTILENEIRELREKADGLAKKARNADDLQKLGDDDFGLVRKYSSPQGKSIKERLLPMPDKVHAQAVLKKLADYPMSEEERYQVHKKAKDVLGASHREDECKLCKNVESSTGGETVDMGMSENTIKELSTKIDKFCAAVEKLSKQWEGAHPATAGAKEEAAEGQRQAQPVEKANPATSDLKTQETPAAPVKVVKASDEMPAEVKAKIEAEQAETEKAADPATSSLKTQEDQPHGAAPVVKAEPVATSDLKTQDDLEHGAAPVVKAKNPATSDLKTQEDAPHGAAPVVKNEDCVEVAMHEDGEETMVPAEKATTTKASQTEELKKLRAEVAGLKKDLATIKTQPRPRKFLVEKTETVSTEDAIQKGYDEVRTWQKAHPGQDLPAELAQKRDAFIEKSFGDKYGAGTLRKA